MTMVSYNFKRNTGVGIFILGMIAILNFGMTRTVDFAVAKDATRKAIQWSEYLTDRIPDLDKIMLTGKPTEYQIEEIEETFNAGDVFRFKLFDREARLILVSDELHNHSAEFGSGDHNGNAAEVLDKNEILTEVGDGTQKENRPDLYVEAYVPVKAKNGEVIGVVEVYLDQTPISQLFHNMFGFLAIAIAGAAILMFVLPYVAFLRKNKAEYHSRAKANYLAHHDQLAKLFNRHGVMANLEQRQQAKTIDMSKTALIFLDIDNFKVINDTYGHNVGDAFLAHVGECIAQCIRPNDLAARMGGDEFMIIAERNQLEQIQTLASKILLLVASPMRHEGNTIIGHASIGIHYDHDVEFTIDQRMQKADVALYQAKIDGRNVHRTFDPEMEMRTLRRRKVEAAVQTGLENNRFEVYFQPLLHQKTKQCAGFEALLRLKDQDGNSIGPTEFIPIAECIGLINEIGLWVLETALTAAAEWPDQLFVSVNLSARQFDQNTLVQQVADLLKKTGVAPSRLELEVTESLLMENTEKVSAQLEGLRELGVSLAMDDFGTGYSSLGYLWQFGFDKLKIDRSFISGLEFNTEKAREILDTIIMLGHKLDMTVTAEGIETEQQENVLSTLECDHFQGFKYGKPMPISDLPHFLLNSTLPEQKTAEIVPIRRKV